MTHFRNCRFAVVAVLAISLGSVPSAAQSYEPQSSPEQIAALHTMADWADDLFGRLPGQGSTADGALARELQAIQGQLVRFDRVMRTDAAGGIDARDLEDLADRLSQVWLDIRDAAPSGEVYSSAAAPPAFSGAQTTVPRGTNVSVELTTWLSSKSANVGDRFSVLLAEPVYVDGRIGIPNGTVMEGMVTAVDRAGRVSDRGNLHLYIDRLRGPEGQIADFRGLVIGLDSGQEIKGQGVSAGKTVAGAVVGGLLGSLIDGKKGALIGLGVGAGGTLLAQSGKDVDLPQGSVLRVEIQDTFSFGWSWPNL